MDAREELACNIGSTNNLQMQPQDMYIDDQAGRVIQRAVRGEQFVLVVDYQRKVKAAPNDITTEQRQRALGQINAQLEAPRNSLDGNMAELFNNIL